MTIQNRRASSTHEESRKPIGRRATTGGYPARHDPASDPSLVPDWPGPPSLKRATVSSAALDVPLKGHVNTNRQRQRSVSRQRSVAQPLEPPVRLELVMEKLPQLRTSHACIEDSVHAALTSAARLPVESLRVSKIDWDALGRPTLNVLVESSEKLPASRALKRIMTALDNTRSPFQATGPAQESLLAGAFLRRPTRRIESSQGPDTVPLRIIASPGFETSLSTSEIGEIIRIGLLRAARLPSKTLTIEKCSRDQGGQLVVSLVAYGQGRLEANDVTAKLIASVEDTSSSMHKRSGLLSALLANGRLEVGTLSSSFPGDRMPSNARARSLSTRRTRERSRTPSRHPSIPPRRPSQPRTKSKVSVPRERETVDNSKLIALQLPSSPDTVAEELNEWAKTSMADLFRGVTTRSEASRTGGSYSAESGSSVRAHTSENHSINDIQKDWDRLMDNGWKVRRSQAQELTPKSGVRVNSPREGHRGSRERRRSRRIGDQLQSVAARSDTCIEELSGCRPIVESRSQKAHARGSETTERDFLDEIQDELLVLRTSLHPPEPSQEVPIPTGSSSLKLDRNTDYSALSVPSLEAGKMDNHTPSKPTGSQALVGSTTLRRRSYGEVRKEAARAHRDPPTVTTPVLEPEPLTKFTLSDVSSILEDPANINDRTGYLGQSDPHNENSGHPESIIVSAYRTGTSSQSSGASVTANSEISSHASRPIEPSRRTSSTSVVSAARKSQIIDMVLKGLPKSPQTIVTGSDFRRSFDRRQPREFYTRAECSTGSNAGRTHAQEVDKDALAPNHPASRKQISSTSSSDSKLSPGGSSSVRSTEDAKPIPPSRSSVCSSEVRRMNVPSRMDTRSPVPAHDAKSTVYPTVSMPMTASTGNSVYHGILDRPVSSQPAAADSSVTSEAVKSFGGLLSRYHTPEEKQQASSAQHSSKKEQSKESLPSYRKTEPSRPELPPTPAYSVPTASYVGTSLHLDVGSVQPGLATNITQPKSGLSLTAFSAPVVDADSELPVFRDPSWLMSPRGSTINITGQTITSVDDQGDGADSWAIGAIDPYSLRDGSKAWQCVVRSVRRGIPETVAQVGLGVGLCSDPIGILDCNLVTDLPSAVILGYDCSAVFANDDWCDVTQVIGEHWACNLEVGDVITLVLSLEALHVLVNWQEVQSQAIGSDGLTDPHLVIDLVGTVESVSLHGHYQIELSAHRLLHY